MSPRNANAAQLPSAALELFARRAARALLDAPDPAFTAAAHASRHGHDGQGQRVAAVLIPVMAGPVQIPGAGPSQGSTNDGASGNGCDPDGLHVLLTRRPHTLRHHAGQIAFPGGKIDPDDVDVIATALRETHEEVGIARDGVRVIGHLPAVATLTGFVVAPVVGIVAPGHAVVPAPDEVEEAFTVPLGYLLNADNHLEVINAPDGSGGSANGGPAAAAPRVASLPAGYHLSGRRFDPGQLSSQQSRRALRPIADASRDSEGADARRTDGRVSNVPFEPRLRCAIAWRGHTIWGATAAMIRLLHERLIAA